MPAHSRPVFASVALLAFGAALAWGIYLKLQERGPAAMQTRERLPAPVEVAMVEVGSIEDRRGFTGTLEAGSEFIVAPKIAGRIIELRFDLADRVRRGDVVAVLDAAEYVQEVAQAEAELEVARASHSEALGLLEIAERELRRAESIRARGDISESQFDVIRSGQLAKLALTRVTRARIARAEAELESTRIRLGYTRVQADWQGGGAERVVAQRFVDAGETVAANAPLLRIVELDPITAVFFVTERDYARLSVGQQAILETDAFPGERFTGSVLRIAPVFSESTRQARIELRVDNADQRLKPGMFVRASVVLQRVDDAVIVPEQALLRRDDGVGVFLVGGDGATARWRAVETGIRQGARVQVAGEGIEGRVVVLGQQLLEDGSALRVVAGGGQ